MTTNPTKNENDLDDSLNPDPEHFDHGAMTAGTQNFDDKRTHAERLNGESITGPAVVPRKFAAVWLPQDSLPKNAVKLETTDLVTILVEAEQDAAAAFAALAHGEGGVAKIQAVLAELVAVVNDVAPLVSGDAGLEAAVQAFVKTADALLPLLNATIAKTEKLEAVEVAKVEKAEKKEAKVKEAKVKEADAAAKKEEAQKSVVAATDEDAAKAKKEKAKAEAEVPAPTPHHETMFGIPVASPHDPVKVNEVKIAKEEKVKETVEVKVDPRGPLPKDNQAPVELSGAFVTTAAATPEPEKK